MAWWAGDVKGMSNVLCRSHTGVDGGSDPSLVSILKRKRVSSHLAIALWGTPWEGRMVERGTVVLGDDGGGGHHRCCLAKEFYEALGRLLSDGEPGVRLQPPRGWLGRLKRRDGRLLWDLVEDASLLQLVPGRDDPSPPADPQLLAAVLEWTLQDVLRVPPRHPRVEDIPFGYIWPRIKAVDIGN